MDEFYEYVFEDSDNVTEIVPADVVAELRHKYADDCYELAADIAQQLLDIGLLCAVATVQNGDPLKGNRVVLWSEIEREHKTYVHHSVVLLGDCIMDLLHYDKLIRTETYFNGLMQSHEALSVVQDLSGVWYDAEGNECEITVERLSSGEWG